MAASRRMASVATSMAAAPRSASRSTRCDFSSRFSRARELLHQADPRHRHEIAGERPRVGPFRRNVLDAELELGVGQFARRSCHLARGFDHRALRSQLRRPRHREPDRLGQRQRIGGGACARHRDDGEDGGGQRNGDPPAARRARAMPASGCRTGRVANAGVATCDLHQGVERTGARSSVPVSDKRGDQIRRWPYRRTIGGPAECGAGSRAEGDAAAASAASESAGTGIGASITGGRSTAVAGVAPSLQCTSHRFVGRRNGRGGVIATMARNERDGHRTAQSDVAGGRPPCRARTRAPSRRTGRVRCPECRARPRCGAMIGS